ncbi:hypothetical protein HanXRQr2_Chr08g0326781 [Helianthus annuus]|uniref:Uncharacterized protein n=1 Tax=Helianthus annuus TaxID=4232 RepID=A0A9K3ICT1_HELAN|nr:hypothetical protein HanXRQr2_Chr08g0326781 [Helianthus annuus]KAJ0545735.1 hypothetical protein HanIR_Chr08g0353061 [Helianthus annuus]
MRSPHLRTSSPPRPSSRNQTTHDRIVLRPQAQPSQWWWWFRRALRFSGRRGKLLR